MHIATANLSGEVVVEDVDVHCCAHEHEVEVWVASEVQLDHQCEEVGVQIALVHFVKYQVCVLLELIAIHTHVSNQCV